MSTAVPPSRDRPAVLYDIDWHTYTRLLHVFERSRRLRLTYDRGILEIREPLFEYEVPGGIAGRFVHVLTEELNLSMRGGGSVTLRRKRKQRGLESYNCYWIASAPRMKGKTHLDLRIDPPPDLAIEVDVRNSWLNRMSIYAAVSVPEVWRVSGRSLTFNILTAGAYQVHPNSLAFPQLASVALAGFLGQIGQTDDTTLVRQFRVWVRQHLLGDPAPASPPRS
jgi:Uma2 family endonuclease